MSEEKDCRDCIYFVGCECFSGSVCDNFKTGERKREDTVNHPKHYTDGKIEVIEFIEDKQLDFCLGNAIKYISRAGKKDPTKEIEDLRKAIWYINRRILEVKRKQRK